MESSYRSRSALTPHGREPGLPLAREAGWAVVVAQLVEAGGGDVAAPRLEVEEAAVAAAAPAFLVVAARVRAEQDAARFQGRGDLEEHARQLAARHMEQRGVGKYPVEA